MYTQTAAISRANFPTDCTMTSGSLVSLGELMAVHRKWKQDTEWVSLLQEIPVVV